MTRPPHETLPEPPGFRRRWSYIVGSVSLVAIFVASGAPVPLYPVYRAENGVSDTLLAFITFGYLVAVLASLMVFGRLSDHLGRKVIAVTALSVAAAGTIVLAGVDSPGDLLTGRVLQGVACGLAPSCLGAYVSELVPARRSWLAALMAGSGPMMGISTGAISAGALVQYAPHPRQLAYIVIAAILVVCAVMMAFCPESVARQRNAFRSLLPRLRAPKAVRRPLTTACLAAVATWPIGGFYQAFAPSVAAQYFGAGNALVAAAVFASVLVLNPVAGPLVGRRVGIGWVHLAMGVYVLALGALLVALQFAHVVAFMAAGLCVGLAQGMASTAAMGLLLPATTRADRAGVLATLYVVSYFASTFAVAAAGVLTMRLSLDHVLIVFVVFGVAAALATSVSALSMRTILRGR